MNTITVKCVNHDKFDGHPDGNPHTTATVRFDDAAEAHAMESLKVIREVGCQCGGAVEIVDED
jgi:hypothetical protein